MLHTGYWSAKSSSLSEIAERSDAGRHSELVDI